VVEASLATTADPTSARDLLRRAASEPQPPLDRITVAPIIGRRNAIAKQRFQKGVYRRTREGGKTRSRGRGKHASLRGRWDSGKTTGRTTRCAAISWRPQGQVGLATSVGYSPLHWDVTDPTGKRGQGSRPIPGRDSRHQERRNESWGNATVLPPMTVGCLRRPRSHNRLPASRKFLRFPGALPNKSGPGAMASGVDSAAPPSVRWAPAR